MPVLSQAYNFYRNVNKVWFSGHSLNAAEQIKRARLCVENLGPIAIEDFIHNPGDIPASLYRWPDGSTLVIFDDGSGMQSPSFVKEPSQ